MIDLDYWKSLSINPRIRSRDSASIGVLASKASNCGFLNNSAFRQRAGEQNMLLPPRDIFRDREVVWIQTEPGEL